MDNIDKTLGNKVKALREETGLSQQELAIKIKVSRPTLSQIENGERKLTPDELMVIAKIFNTSIDALLNMKKEPVINLEKEEVEIEPRDKGGIRINVPKKNLKKFKEVLLYILNKVGSKSNVGETVIYKLLYFIDFDYYEMFEEQLIGATYIKNHYGPTPVEFKKIVDTMLENKDLIKVESEYFNYPQTKYLPLRQADISVLNGNETAVIDKVLNKLSDYTARQISNYSHEDVPWQVTEDGQPIEYETVFYRTNQYSAREYDEE
ncbi:MAG: type II toxin-antitoxin system antitoxin SocA domain-containing protein [Spirochaetota bacterium]